MKLWVAILLCAVTWTASLDATNGMSSIGTSVKSRGMGGVSVALPLDSFVIASNPAGILDLGCRADIELGYTFQDGFCDAIEGGSAPTSLTSKSDHGLWWPAMGVTIMIDPCTSLGIAAYTLGANDLSWDPPLLFLGNPPVAGNPRSATMMQNYFVAITPSFAWRFCKNQALGIAPSVVFGSCILKGVSRLNFGSQLPAYLTDNGADVSVGVNLRIGWLGDFFCDTLRIGVSVVSKSYMSRFVKYQGVIGDYGAFQWPWSAEIGFAWFFHRCWVVSVDYRYIQWKSNDGMQFSNFVNQANRGNETRGLWDGEGFGWNNQSVAKIGFAWTPLCCLTLRAGYNYNTQPIPTSEMLLGPLTNAVIKHHVTLGATYRTCVGELSAYYAYGFRRTQENFAGLFPPQETETNRVQMRNEQNELGLAWGVCF